MAKNKSESVDTDETVESPAAETTATTEAKPAKAPIDLTSFQSAVDEAIEQAGESSEPNEDSVGKVLTAFHELEGRAKTAARKAIRDQILASLDESKIAAAQTLNKLNSALDEQGSTKSSTPKAAKTPVDPTEAHVKKTATLTIALALLGQHAAEGVADDAQAQADALYQEAYGTADGYLAWLNGGKEGDEPEATDIAKEAAKLVVAKKVRSSGGAGTSAVRTYSGPQRSTQKHIEEAFADVESGTHLTVGEIVNKRSNEYGDDKPSAGAISGALKSSKFAVEGVIPDAEDASPYGATKA